MNDIAYEIEERLRERISPPDRVRVMTSSARGLLPNRAPFVRVVYKQHTLDEWLDEGEAPAYFNDVHYTVHPSWLKPSKRSELVEMLESDLDDLMAKW